MLLKSILISIGLVALPSVVLAASVSVPMQVTATDLQIFATAIDIARKQCGADAESACEVGKYQKLEMAKLNAAFATIQSLQKQGMNKR